MSVSGAGGGAPLTLTYAMAKTDHCQYLEGKFTLYTRGLDGVGACHPVPPPGVLSTRGQGRAAALDACLNRCLPTHFAAAQEIVWSYGGQG